MPAVSNKTRKPLSIPLPGGKILHLGPGKTAQIAANAVESAAVKSLVEAGEIEIAEKDSHDGSGGGGGVRGRGAGYLPSSTGIRRSGNR